MFNNIGEKIKALAYCIAILGFLGSLIGAIVLWSTGYQFFIGFITLIAGCIVPYIFSMLIYGFGELITQVTDISKGNKRMQMLSVCEKNAEDNMSKNDTVEQIYNDIINDYEQGDNTPDEDEDFENTASTDECPRCFAKISPDDTECPNCGYKLK